MDSEVEQEIRPVPGFPRLFASDQGRIWRRRGDTVKPVRPHTDDGRYYVVNAVVESGKWATRRVHRLVALAFHGLPPHENSYALHRNGSKLDNQPSNIYWGDAQLNGRDTVKHGRSLKGSANPAAKLDAQKAAFIREAAAMGISRVALAERSGVSESCIRNVLNKKSWVEEAPAPPLAV